MKRNILKMFAVITAFFIGISINNSCGESKIDDGRSVQDLWNAIYALQAEVNALKTSGSTNGETLIDGLYFTRNGTVSYDSNTQRKYTFDIFKIGYTDTNTSTYTYDSKGRIQRITTTSTNSTSGDSRSIATFEYSDKKVIKTVTTTDNNGNNTTSQTTEEYY